MSAKSFEDVYPLSPTQEGMLFHTVSMPGTAVYIEQSIFELNGRLDTAAFQTAWGRAINHHTILRSAFVWDGFNEPLQAVRHQVKLPWRFEDWMAQNEDQQEKMLTAFLRQDRQQGFELEEAPLMRVALFQLAAQKYRFVLTNHHLLLDGWSLPLLLRDVFTLYGDPATELPPSRPFKDYIAWLQAKDMTQAEAFWKGELGDFDEPLSLALDKPALTADEAKFVDVEIPAVHAALPLADLQACAQQEKLTLNTFAHGAWAMLLSYYAQTQDVLFGSTVSGRPVELEHSADMVGVFINTLPIRLQIEGERPLHTWLNEVQERLLACRDFDYSSLVDIHGWSGVARQQSLFDSVLIFENNPGIKGQEADSDLQVTFVKGIERTNYPLTLAVTPLETTLALRLEYDGKLFGTADMQQMINRLAQLLSEIPATLHEPLSAWSPHTSADKQQLAALERAAPPQPYQPVHTWFARQSQQQPDKTALLWGEGDEQLALTYEQLNQQSSQLAHYLQGQGIVPGDIVAISLPRTKHLVIAILGVLKTGAAFVILDSNAPEERNNFILSDVGASLLLTQEKMDFPAEQGIEVIYLNKQQDEIDQQSHQEIDIQPTADNLAYIVYTSGTTGRPKGVKISHGNLFHTLSASQVQFGFNESDQMLCLAAFSFDISLFELFNPLLAGGTSSLLNDDQLLDLHVIVQRLNTTTALHAVPGMMQQIVDYVRAGQQPQDYPKLVKLFVGGEAVSPKLLRAMQETFPHAAVHVLYGPTEATIICSSHTLRPGESVSGYLIGAPLPGVTLHTYTTGQQTQTPPGLPGELFIGGPGVSQGYVKSPELTQQQFVTIEGQTFYRTGDLVRCQPGTDKAAPGPLEFLGRTDRQMKIRGVRIEPGEIEYNLLQHPSVKEALVVLHEEKDDIKQLLAYVVVNEEDTVEAAELRQWLWLQKQLPNYMIPALFIPLEKFPRTAHGKIDHKALPQPGRDRFQFVSREIVLPDNPIQEELVEIWKEVLQVSEVSVADNFFELGGHSLLATRLISAIREAFQIDLPLHVLFSTPMIAPLAEVISYYIIEQADDSLLEEAMGEIADLSPEEIEALLMSEEPLG